MQEEKEEHDSCQEAVHLKDPFLFFLMKPQSRNGSQDDHNIQYRTGMETDGPKCHEPVDQCGDQQQRAGIFMDLPQPFHECTEFRTLRLDQFPVDKVQYKRQNLKKQEDPGDISK